MSNNAPLTHVLMGDTDSAYVRLDLYAEKHALDLDRAVAIDLADKLQLRLKEDLAPMIAAKFATDPEHIAILDPGRETVGRRGLFKDKKKRYAIHVVDDEGKTVDKLKIMGMETRRSDTPAVIQDFLTNIVTEVVMKDMDYEDVKELVEVFRTKFRAMDPWRQGSPGRVKNLARATAAYKLWEKQVGEGGAGKKLPQMHVTVKAALSTNRLMDFNGETRWDYLRDGDKVEVIYLKPNPEKLDCVAIKTGEAYVPEWFQELPFDTARMEEKLVDKKLFNVIGDILGWDFSPPKTYADELIEVDDFYA